eukprot:m.80807 g.80807  ORF g.80807 m.80807 type:complete len:414 (+) comp16316_c0_seq3:361-1602(+)
MMAARALTPMTPAGTIFTHSEILLVAKTSPAPLSTQRTSLDEWCKAQERVEQWKRKVFALLVQQASAQVRQARGTSAELHHAAIRQELHDSTLALTEARETASETARLLDEESARARLAEDVAVAVAAALRATATRLDAAMAAVSDAVHARVNDLEERMAHAADHVCKIYATLQQDNKRQHHEHAVLVEELAAARSATIRCQDERRQDQQHSTEVVEAWQQRCGKALASQRALQAALTQAQQQTAAVHAQRCRSYEVRIHELEQMLEVIQQRAAVATERVVQLEQAAVAATSAQRQKDAATSAQLHDLQQENQLLRMRLELTRDDRCTLARNLHRMSAALWGGTALKSPARTDHRYGDAHDASDAATHAVSCSAGRGTASDPAAHARASDTTRSNESAVLELQTMVHTLLSMS